jgi:hypothetical protein
MRTKHVLSLGLGLLTLAMVATAADAAPVTSLAATTEASGATLVEKAHWYRRHYRPYYYRYYYYPRHYRYDYYPHYYYPRHYRYHW